MPFTVSHAAAAWPLTHRRSPLITSALVLGTMSPDFEYLVRLIPSRTTGHTLIGVFTLDLPLSLAALAILHGILKRPLLRLVPPRWGHLAVAADQPFRVLPVSRLVWIVVSILVGTATHIAWDAVTHGGEWVPMHVGLLSDPLVRLGGHRLTGTRILFYASSVGGLVLMALWFRGWARAQSVELRDNARPLPAGSRRVVIAAIVACAALGGFLGLSDALATNYSTARGNVAAALVGTMAGGLGSAVAYAAWATRKLE